MSFFAITYFLTACLRYDWLISIHTLIVSLDIAYIFSSSDVALPEASDVMGSDVLVMVRWSNGVDGSIDVIDRIDRLYGILMGRMSSKNHKYRVFGEKKQAGKRRERLNIF